jgi:hypothetical protein
MRKREMELLSDIFAEAASFAVELAYGPVNW